MSHLGEYSKNALLLHELLQTDFIRKLEPLFAQGWYISSKTGKLCTRPGAVGIQHNTNWIHTNPDPTRRCRFYQLIHEYCNFIPKRCLSCWKVVVRPSFFSQLLQLYEIQMDLSEENPKCWCKCGWEDRDWVHGNYGGYFYCNSKEVGLQRLETVRNAVRKNVDYGDKIDIFLKRYCTEFELKWGDSAKYERQPEADIMETAIFEGSEIKNLAVPQPQSVKNHIMGNWILDAYRVGDRTVTFYNVNLPLYTPSTRYEKDRTVSFDLEKMEKEEVAKIIDKQIQKGVKDAESKNNDTRTEASDDTKKSG